jgi:saccharopine dehydrogenase-like NADP-dependent oxidoreductase
MILAEVTGRKDGDIVTHRLHAGLRHEEAAKRFGATATGYLVGTGAAVFAIQFARGQIRQRGVIAAECLDPAESLRLLASMGIRTVHEASSTHALN